jgi:hypothetical protein
MKIIIGTPFLRNESTENEVLLKQGEVIEDFTESELKKYEGLYSSVETKETEVKEKLTDKKLKINKT